MDPYPYYRLDPDELDAELARAGFITEEERISRGYQRIFARMMKRGLRRTPRSPR